MAGAHSLSAVPAGHLRRTVHHPSGSGTLGKSLMFRLAREERDGWLIWPARVGCKAK